LLFFSRFQSTSMPLDHQISRLRSCSLRLHGLLDDPRRERFIVGTLRCFSTERMMTTDNQQGASRRGDESEPGTPQTAPDLCPACGGSGEVNGAPCSECDGTGTITAIVGDA
jgi:hypothetical protein